LHKKTFLLFLSVLFLLTGCNKTDSAEHTNADNDRKLSSDVSAETTKSSITTSPKNADAPEDGSTPGNSDTPEGGSTPGNSDTPEGGSTPGNADTPEGGSTPGNSDTPEGGSTLGNADTTKGGSTPGSTGATENPEETLNNILNELQELDELINGNE
jgi:hypothetical protein